MLSGDVPPSRWWRSAGVTHHLIIRRDGTTHCQEKEKKVSGFIFLLGNNESAEDKIKPKSKELVNDASIKDITPARGTLEYGTRTIKVHGRKINQIEVAEKDFVMIFGACNKGRNSRRVQALT